MTPAINTAKAAGIKFKALSYEHDANHPSYGMEAVEKLGLEATRVFKTLLLNIGKDEFAVTIIPVANKLNLKAAAKALSRKKVTMAGTQDAERGTGYLVGGISPIGQKKRLATLLDKTALEHETIYVSAGRRGLEIELATKDLVRITDANLADLCV